MKRITALLLVLLMLPSLAWAQTAPAPSTSTCGKEHCYWETPMDISDPDALWQMLIQPMTVVDGEQRVQVQLMAEPSEDAEMVGEVTCDSQGVHVLETLDNGWSLVECYSSSNGKSKLKVFGDLVQGYLPTELLVERKTRTEYGLIVDKMTQRLYLFEDGKLLSTLRVSTGKATDKMPQCDTNAGEFHLVSWVGDFPTESGAMCEYGIRFNDGDLLHGVPYYETEDGEKDYSKCEKGLGREASSGCIRVQRKRTPEGVNMLWIWNRLFNLKRTKLVIWEDVPGRQMDIPSGDTPVYILPQLSNGYHRQSNCYDLDKAYFPLEEITYAQLEDAEYVHLKNCSFCNPPLRVADIEKLNQKYAVDPAAE